jgi:hypothetical protein
MLQLNDYELLGDVTDSQIKEEVTRFMASVNQNPTALDVSTLLGTYATGDRDRVKKELLIQGVPSIFVDDSRALVPYFNSKWFWVHSALSSISGAACAYHGYKRNNSVGWAIGWFFLGSIFFPLTPVIALAQGFGKPKKAV